MCAQPSRTRAKSTASSAEIRTVQLMQRLQVRSMGARLFWIGLVAGCVCVMALISCGRTRCRHAARAQATDMEGIRERYRLIQVWRRGNIVAVETRLGPGKTVPV